MFIDNARSDWTEGNLSDIADITMGQSPSGSSYNENGNGTIFFQGRAEFVDLDFRQFVYTPMNLNEWHGQMIF